jgi:hypothetical protein
MREATFRLLSLRCMRLQRVVQPLSLCALVVVSLLVVAPAGHPTPRVERAAVPVRPPRPASTEKPHWEKHRDARRDRCVEFRVANKLVGAPCGDDGFNVRASGVTHAGTPVTFTCDESRCWW